MLRHLSVGIALMFVTPGSLAAHEFELLLLAPDNAATAEIDDMRAAFLIASHERDDHPNETSEGHLGGLDVQLTLLPLDRAGSADAAPVVVAAPFALATEPRVAALAAGGGAAILDRAMLAALPVAVLLAGNAAAGLGPFADRYRAETGRAPSNAAEAAYLSARVVDMAIRPLGSVDDRAALRRSMAP